jgi:hypothetical protein
MQCTGGDEERRDGGDGEDDGGGGDLAAGGGTEIGLGPHRRHISQPAKADELQC